MSTAESPSRLWYQSFVDPNEQRPYIDRLRGHLASIADPGFSCEVVGISPPDRILHPLTEFRCATQVIRNAIAVCRCCCSRGRRTSRFAGRPS